MIFPGEIDGFTKRPDFKVSWLIVLTNIIIYALLQLQSSSWPADLLYEKMNKSNFKLALHEMYQQTLDPVLKKNKLPTPDESLLRALRDVSFEQRLASFPFIGDEIQMADVKNTLFKFYEGYHHSPQYLYGLSTVDISPWSWLTYQFVHGSLIHLLGNLFIIFLCLSFLEKKMESFEVLAVYLISGFMGGVFFLISEPVNGLSMVGASAAAFGLLGFLLITENIRLIPWFYIIAPIKNGYGRIHLPVFFILPVLMMSDFMSLLKDSSGIGGNIAVSAHVGGGLTGMFLALVYLFFRRKTTAHRIFSNHDRLHELA